MKMSSADQAAFPRFADYVKNSLMQVASVPLIVANMKRFGSLSETEFRNALTWGTDPLIVITTLPPGAPGAPAGCGADGGFFPTDPSEINIDLGRVQDFEAAPMNAVDQNARGERVIIVGAVLLHELCHWGNFKHGVAETTEAGIAFCVATYGRRIPFFGRGGDFTITP